MAATIPDSFQRLAAAMELYRREEISAGEAADHAGISKGEFLRRRGEFGVLSIPDRTDDELQRELAQALKATGH